VEEVALRLGIASPRRHIGLRGIGHEHALGSGCGGWQVLLVGGGLVGGGQGDAGAGRTSSPRYWRPAARSSCSSAGRRR